MTEHTPLAASYDEHGDVLYVSVAPGAAARGMEDHDGIVWRFADDGSSIGATVLDLHDTWAHDEPHLAAALSARLQIPLAQALHTVRHAMLGGAD